MEFEDLAPTSKAWVESPRDEHLAEPGVWSTENFQEYLYQREELPSFDLPREIWLDERWHDAIRYLTMKTGQDGNEWSVSVACIDKTVDNARRLSLPFDYQEYFDDIWGSPENPIFTTEPLKGTPNHARDSTIPSVIEWEDQLVALKRAGSIHTHPSQSAFSVGDMFWVTRDHPQRFLMAATTSYNFMFLKTADQPVVSSSQQEDAERTANAYVQQQIGRPNWKERYFGFKDVSHDLRWFQAIYELSHEFCRTYKVGLYGGVSGKPLTRLS